jgi:hypothetical protein
MVVIISLSFFALRDGLTSLVVGDLAETLYFT